MTSNALYNFYNPVQIHFGEGIRSNLQVLLGSKKYLVVCSGRGRKQFTKDKILQKLIIDKQILWLDTVKESPTLIDIQKQIDLMKNEKFDGLIITGAPIEHLDFADVTYWKEMVEVMNWTQTNVQSTLGVCWGGMAMINHFHSIKKHELIHKAFGCFRHQNLEPASPYLRGFSDDFVVPVSRWTEMKQDEINSTNGLRTLLGSQITGPCLVEDSAHRALYIFNHFE